PGACRQLPWSANRDLVYFAQSKFRATGQWPPLSAEKNVCTNNEPATPPLTRIIVGLVKTAKSQRIGQRLMDAEDRISRAAAVQNCGRASIVVPDQTGLKS